MTKEDLTLLDSKEWRMNNLYRIVNKQGDSVKFRLNPVQQEVLKGLHNRNLILKARQLGMSSFSVLYMLDETIFNSNLSAGIVSYSLEHAQHIFKRILGHALDNLSPEMKTIAGMVQRSAREITFKNGSFLRVDTTLRGGAYQSVLVSEFGKTCARNPLKAEEVMTGTLQTVPIDGQVIIESTAEGAEGYYYEMIMNAAQHGNENLSPLSYKLFFFNWLTESKYRMKQPVTIDYELLEYFKKIEKETGCIIDQEQRNWYAHQRSILGDKIHQEFCSTITESFLSNSDAYYFQQGIEKAYNESRMLNTPLYDALAPVYIAMDIGVNDLTCIIFFQVVHGEVRIIDYYEDNNKGVDFYCNFLLNDKRYIYKTIFLPHDAAKRDGIVVENTYERDFKRYMEHTATKVKVLKRTDKNLQINNAKIKLDRCVFALQRTKPLIDHLMKYRKKWSEQLGRYLDSPIHNIACFIGETLIETDKGKKRIDQMKIGDKVLTPNGLCLVKNVFKHKTNRLVKVKTKETEIACTPHHMIFTTKGLKKADALCYTDQIINIEDEVICRKVISHGMEKKLGFKDSFLSMNQKQLSSLMDINTKKINLVTGLVEEKPKALEHYIEACGDIIMGIFQKTIWYITSMEINLIMKSKTLSLCQAMITYPCTCQLKKESLYQDRLLKKHKKQLKYGMDQKKGLNGIKNMERKFLQANRYLKELVKYVAKNIHLNGKDQECVQMHVEQNLEEEQVRTTKKEYVQYVEKNLNVLNTRKLKHVLGNVEQYLGTEIDVYDLEIERDHCYFANGLLVSNSNAADAFQYVCSAVDNIEKVSSSSGALDKHKRATESRRYQM